MGVVRMNRRLWRSAAAALRVTLLSGCGALGLMALSAGSATADDGAGQGLLGSLTPVVESVPAPVEPVQGVTAPLQTVTQNEAVPLTPVQAVTHEVAVPLAPIENTFGPASEATGLASGVPQLVSTLDVSEAVAPITGVVDSTLAQVPIVNQVVPSGTTTAISQPLLETVDLTVTPVLRPVAQVLAPVVGAVDPVLAPVAGGIDPAAAPTSAVVADKRYPLPTRATSPIGAGASAEVRGNPGQSAGPAKITDAAGQAELPPAVTRELPSPDANSLRLFSPGSSPDCQGARHLMQAAPQLVVRKPQPVADPVALPATASGTSGASAGSSAPGGAGAADTPTVFIFTLLSAVSQQSGDSVDLPQGPAFDPGSTPD